MNYYNKDISMGGVESVNEFSRVAVDMEKIRKMLDVLEEE
jgi:predicted DNA-binding protein YlxM (UPF0122 family)